MSNAIDWDLAERVATKIATRNQFEGSYYYDAMRRDFEELTAKAEQLVAAETGLESQQGPARARVADRPMWIRANIASFQRLLKPLTEKLVGDEDLDGPFAAVTNRVGAVQVGFVLGWMSTRVLGQYDLLIVEDENPEDQDIVYYVGPNIMALERKHGFDARQFRLWLALHETTHRAQFTGVPWLRDHFLGLVNQTVDNVDPDAGRILDSVRNAIDARRNGEPSAIAEGGLPMLFASPEQKLVLDEVMGMMSLLEGHGDVTMDRAGEGEVPSAPYFGSVLRARRNSARGVSKIMMQLLGIEAKLNQYALGENFIEEVEDAGGRELLDVAWSAPEYLPSIEEIKEPKLWIARAEPQLATSSH